MIKYKKETNLNHQTAKKIYNLGDKENYWLTKTNQ